MVARASALQAAQSLPMPRMRNPLPPALEVMANTLRRTSWLAAGVGYVLIFGIGVLLFSFAILQTLVVPKWIGWLGLIAVAVNVALVTLLSGVFDSSIRPPWLLASGTSLGWVLAMGVVLLRLKEPVVPDSAISS